MLLDFDHHSHTPYSRHSHPEMTVANSLAAAASKNLKRHVILEHVPEIGSSERGTPELWYTGKNERWQLDAIAKDLSDLTPGLNYPDLKVLRGVEVDADPFKLDGSCMLEDFTGLDVVLGSTHLFPGGTAFWFEKVVLPPEQARRVAQNWRDWAVRFVRAGQIDVLSHPGDLVGARQLVPPFNSPETLELFEPLLKAMAESHVAFELNESLGAKLAPPYRAGYPALVRLAKQVGCRFSVGSDAHAPQNIGRYEWVHLLIREASLTESNLWVPEG
jgi:HisJ family histidinol phosphate phosphatase